MLHQPQVTHDVAFVPNHPNLKYLTGFPRARFSGRACLSLPFVERLASPAIVNLWIPIQTRYIVAPQPVLPVLLERAMDSSSQKVFTSTLGRQS